MKNRKIYSYVLFVLISSANVFAFADDSSSASADSKTSYDNALNKLVQNSSQSIKEANENIQQEAVVKSDQDREQKAREFYQKGVALANQGKLDEARDYFQKAISLTSPSQSKEGDNQPEKTINVSNQNDSNKPTLSKKENQVVAQVVVPVSSQIQKPPQAVNQDQVKKEEESIYNQAIDLFKNEKFAEAKSKFEEVNLVVPGYKDINKYLSRVNKKLQEQEKQAQADQTHQQELEKERKRAQEFRKINAETEKIYTQALVLYRNHQYEESKDVFLKVKDKDSNYKSTQYYLGKIDDDIKEAQAQQIRQQQLVKEREFAEAQKQKNMETEKIYLKALALYRNHQYQDARDVFLKVKDRDSSYKSTQRYIEKIDDRIKRAQELVQRQKDLEQERQKAEELKKKNAEIEKIYVQALALYHDHSYQDAMDEFFKVKNIDPSYKSTQYYIAKIGSKIKEGQDEDQRQKLLALQDQERGAKAEVPVASPVVTSPSVPVSAPVVVIPPPVLVSPPPKPAMTIEDQQKQTQGIALLAEKSAQLYRQIAEIANDNLTEQTRKKMAEVDEIMSSLKETTQKDLNNREFNEWKSKQEVLRDKEIQRRAESQRIYHDAVEYLKSHEYAKAKIKFLELESIYPNYKATRRYLIRIEDDQKRAGVQAVTGYEQQEALRLRTLQDKENAKEFHHAQEEQEKQEKLEQQQQVALQNLAQKASAINDDIIRLSRQQDLEAMKSKFRELENTVDALRVLKDEIAKEKDTQQVIKKEAQEDIRQRNEALAAQKKDDQQIHAYYGAENSKEYRPVLSDQPIGVDQFKRHEVLEEQNNLFNEAVGCYEHKKYTQAKLLFGELASKNDRRAEIWLKKVDHAITRELLGSQESEERERTAFINDQVKAQRELIIIQERERERQKRLTEELEHQKRYYEDDHLLQLRKEETMKAQERERQRQEQKRLALQKENQRQQQMLRFHKINTPPVKPVPTPQPQPVVVAKPVAPPAVVAVAAPSKPVVKVDAQTEAEIAQKDAEKQRDEEEQKLEKKQKELEEEQQLTDQREGERQARLKAKADAKAQRARIIAEREAQEQKHREEVKHQQELQRQEKINQENIMRQEAQHRQELERQERQRQAELEAQREIVRKQLEDGVESMYQEALALYKQGNYSSAADRFKDVIDILPGYKNSQQYLDDARQKSIIEKSQLVSSSSSNDSRDIPSTPVAASSSPAVSHQDNVSKALDLFDPNAK